MTEALRPLQKLLQIGIDDLMPDPSQPRKTFLPDEIDRLTSSIRARGVLIPLLVMRDEERKCWLIVTGESRWRAARKAELATVPCLEIQGQPDEADLLADRLTENSLRHDLPPMEEAAAMAKLKALLGCNSKTLVEKYGFTGASITRMESLLRLPPEIQGMVGSEPGQISPSSAYELSKLDSEQAQFEFANAVVSQGIKRDRLAEMVRQRNGSANPRPKPSRLVGRLDGDVSITVSANKPLTQDVLQKVIDHLKREAKKLPEKGDAAPAPLQAL